MAKDVINTYKIEADKVPGNVSIIKRPEEYTPVYEVKFPTVEPATRAILDSIKEKLIEIVKIEVSEILDPKAMEGIKKRFLKSAIKTISEEMPKVSEEEKNILGGYLVHEMLGLGRLEIVLNDDNLEELVINNSTDCAWVFHKKYGWLKTNIVIPSEEQIYNYASLIGRKVGRQITNLNPLMDAHLITGDRVNATLFPISTGGNTITIRKFRREPWTIIHFVDPANKTISMEIAALLWLCMQYELNILVAGGTASGKCVSGDTKILTSDGKLEKARDIVERIIKKDGFIECEDGFYSFTDELEILTLDHNLKIIPAKVRCVWKRKSPKHMVKVKTKTGKVVEVTLEHPFFIIKDGSIEEIRADQLSKGIQIATPRKTVIDKYRFGERRPKQETLRKVHAFNKLTDGGELEILEELAESDVLWDEVIEIKKIKPKDEWVYDLTIEPTRNFIAGSNGGIIVHNTALLNTLMPFIPPNHRIISIEDTRELRLPDFLHWVPLTTREPNPEGKGEVCLYPGTWFINGEGELHEISEFVNNSFLTKNPQKIKSNVIATDGNSHTVLAGNPRAFDYETEPVKMISKITDRGYICTINCEDGEAIKLTENTKVPVIGENGKIELLTPREIKKKEYYLPIFTEIKVNSSIQKINVFKVFNKNFYATQMKDYINKLIEKLRKRFTLNEIAKKCGIKRQAFTWYKKTGTVNMGVLEKLILIANEDLNCIEKKIKYIKPRGGKLIKVPKIIDEDLAYLAGFLLAEKGIAKNGIFVAQKKDIDFLGKLIKKIFHIEIKNRKEEYNTYQILSTAIKKFMIKVFNLSKSKRIRVPKCIMRSPNKIIAAFLAGYIDGDGSVGKKKISLATSNKRAAKEFKYLLLRLGIWSRLYESKRVTQINICMREDLKKACKLLPFRSQKNKENARLVLNTNFSSLLRRGRIPSLAVRKYLKMFTKYLSKEEKYKYHFYHASSKNGNKSISKSSFSKILKLAKNRGCKLDEKIEKEIKFLIRPNIEFVKIADVDVNQNTENIPSYDITPIRSKYFVAGINNFTLVQDTMLDLLVNSLRMRPDRVVVGEIRRQAEAEVLFEAMHTGHSVYATLHADTAEQVIRRLTNPPIDLPETLLESLHLVVVQFRHRRRGIRRTLQVAELLPGGARGQAQARLETLYRWKPQIDKIIKVRDSIRLIDEIRMHTGMTDEEMENDLREKEIVLQWMLENNIKTVNTVGKVVADYYHDKEKILKIINKKGKPEEILDPSLMKELKKAV